MKKLQKLKKGKFQKLLLGEEKERRMKNINFQGKL